MSNAKKSAIASLLLVSESLAQKMIGLVSTLVLARFLVPEDFGIIAMATLFIYLAEVLSDTGSEQYVLSVEHVDDEVLNTSFTINLIFRAALSVLVVIAAPLIVQLYQDPRLYNIVFVLAGLTLLNCLRNPGLWLLKRSQAYGIIAKWSLISKCLAVIVSVTAAILLQNYWAILLAQVTSSLCMLIISYRIHDFRPKLELRNAARQWSFSIWVIPQSLLGYARTQFDSLLVSALFSQSSLGSYHTMKYLAFIPCSHLFAPATRPLLVELSKIKNNPTHFANQFNVTLLIIMSLALPFTAFLFSFSEDIVNVALGSNWVSYSDLFGILSLIIPSYLMFHQSNRAIYAFGHTRTAAAYEFLSMFALVIILMSFEFDGVTQFASAKLYFETAASAVYLLYVSQRYNGFINTFRMVVIHIPVLLSCSIALYTTTYLISISSPLLNLVFSGFIYLGVFIIAMIVFILLLKHHNHEWKYMNDLLSRLVSSITSGIRRKINHGKVT